MNHNPCTSCGLLMPSVKEVGKLFLCEKCREKHWIDKIPVDVRQEVLFLLDRAIKHRGHTNPMVLGGYGNDAVRRIADLVYEKCGIEFEEYT